jgi:hypothetical protein
MTLVQALIAQNKPDEAIEACKALYDRADWPAPAANEMDKRTPAERLEVMAADGVLPDRRAAFRRTALSAGH